MKKLSLIRHNLLVIVVVMVCTLSFSVVGAAEYSVLDFGAKADGIYLSTMAIQKAIDECSKNGGGFVVFPEGNFLTGTVILKNNVHLKLSPGTIIKGSTELKDYPECKLPFRAKYEAYFNWSLFYAINAKNIGITGSGIIDGNGADKSFLVGKKKDPEKSMNRPTIIKFIDCENVVVKDITLKDAAFWTSWYLGCNNLLIDGVTIRSRRANHNNDGIDIDCCTNVRIANCDIDSEDDAIGLKMTAERDCRNIVITNCLISSACSGIRLGPETHGNFEDISISNCIIYKTRNSAIQIQSWDGGDIKRININNITIKNARSAIFINVGNESYNTGMPPVFKSAVRPGKISDIHISNVTGYAIGSNYENPPNIWGSDTTHLPCLIVGHPESPIENVTLSNIKLSFVGGGDMIDIQSDMNTMGGGFNFDNYKKVPAYGLYCRYTKNLRINSIDFSVLKGDPRPPVFIEESNFLNLSDLTSQSQATTPSFMWLRQVDNAMIHECRTLFPVASFIRVQGDKSKDINVFNNDLGKAILKVDLEKNLDSGVVKQFSNF